MSALNGKMRRMVRHKRLRSKISVLQCRYNVLSVVSTVM